MYCVVQDCKSVWNPKSNIKFHGFPKDDKRRKCWLSTVPLKGEFYKNAKICSLHFKPEDYNPKKPSCLGCFAIPFFKPLACNDCDPLALPPGNTDLSETKPDIDGGHHLEEHLSSGIIDTSETKPDVDGGHHSEEHHTSFEDRPPTKRLCVRDAKTQAKIKSSREIALEKSNKILQQTLNRQKRKIDQMKTLIEIARKYTSQSEIDNILNGNFADMCRAFNRSSADKKIVKYSEEVKAFALALHGHSPKAYEYMRSIMSLPHHTTLWRNTDSLNREV